MSSANSDGRVWSPIAHRSAKPRVIARAVAAPRRSSSALVASVVPMRTSHGGIAAPGASRSSARMPVTAAPPGSSSVDGTFAVRSSPPGPRPMQSVNVPPRSIQIDHGCAGAVISPA